MKKVLLILSTSRTSDKAIEYAVAEASGRAMGLVSLYIIDTELTNEVFDRFTDIGFIGDKPSSELIEAVLKEYRQRGYEEIGKVQIKAMEEGVDFDAVTTQGDFVEEAMRAIEAHGVGLVVAVKRRRTGFLKYFSRSRVDELAETAEKAGCDVKVIEEE